MNIQSNAASLSAEQNEAYSLLVSGENVFLTGGAGTGKSHLIRQFSRNLSKKTFPILASTGAAAVLLGGRTFHSFFGLGIMEGGPQVVFAKASRDRRLQARLKEIDGFVIDEISMIGGEALAVAEALAREHRDSEYPWGGLRIIAVGDFAQLPPISRGNKRDWCFLTETWKASDFVHFELSANHRSENSDFVGVLNKLRWGKIDSDVEDFLNSRKVSENIEWQGTFLFPKRDQVENMNNRRLEEVKGKCVNIETVYSGNKRFVEILRKSAPVPEVLSLKVGCEVLFVQNDTQWKWVNGTKGKVVKISSSEIIVEKKNGSQVLVEKTDFSLQDADGNTVAAASQFPLILGYATTIHKSQGSSLENLCCDLSSLWEPGQAYVAVSRLKHPEGLHLLKWSSSSVIVDSSVRKFYSSDAFGGYKQDFV